jgi:NDP-4-keto-2,6-dideoxyhexose 3-C-methyltransferase
MYTQIDRCRICGNSELVEVLDLGVQALTGVFPRTKREKITQGPLQLVKCMGQDECCGLVQLKHTYALEELYGENYGYRSGLNPSMIAHLKSKVSRILDRFQPPSGSLIIDIGSNDSTTLQAYPQNAFTCVGVDPAGTKFRQFYPSDIQLITDFFSAAVLRKHIGDRRAAVITSFSMFYDLESPLRFVEEISEILEEEGIWVTEQSYMPLMLSRNSYDTVCHEHLEYYALRQIKWMADRADLKIIDVEFNEINGGSTSVVMAKRLSRWRESAAVKEILYGEVREGLDTLEPYQVFSRRVSASRDALRAFLEQARQNGKSVSGLGASTKGNVLLQYCQVTETDVARVGEVNADKFGRFTPGTSLPIVPEEEALAMKPDYLLVLPWHFRSYLLNQVRFRGQTLVFPLPELDIVQCAA